MKRYVDVISKECTNCVFIRTTQFSDGLGYRCTRSMGKMNNPNDMYYEYKYECVYEDWKVPACPSKFSK